MAKIKDGKIKLNDGHYMPLLGLGCWQSSPDDIQKAVEAALDSGYRHIDTAFLYMNEEGVGKGIANWMKRTGNSRKDVFVVTKLPFIGMNPGGPKKYLKFSLDKLKLDYVDLFLIHCPLGFKEPCDLQALIPRKGQLGLELDHSTDLLAIWKEMEKLVEKGLTKSIGVSNYNIKQLRKTIAVSRIKPTVNQVEMHLNFQQKELREYCAKEKIILTAFGALGSPGRGPELVTKGKQLPALLSNPIVKLVANNHKVTTAQILVKFWVQQGVVVIPKSVNPARIKTNGDVFGFELTEVELDALKMLDEGEEGRSFDFLRRNGFEDHPESPF